jgi:large subunit ribosomal protein L21
MTTYAIISVGGKQYRVSEGQRLLVDRLPAEEGTTFVPPVLLVGGEGGPSLAPADVTVTARVVGNRRGPKIRIGKYKKRTGYRRHTGFRAALTQIEIESIGGVKREAKAKPKREQAPKAEAAVPQADASGGVPAGYDDLTVAAIKEQADSWAPAALRAALDHEQAHGKRKGAISALEAAIAKKEANG